MVINCPMCSKQLSEKSIIIDKTTCDEHPDMILFFDCKFRCRSCGYSKGWSKKCVFDICSKCEEDEHVYNRLYQRFIDGEAFRFKVKKVLGFDKYKIMVIQITLLSDKLSFDTVMTRSEVMNLYKKVGQYVPRVFFDQPEREFIA